MKPTLQGVARRRAVHFSRRASGEYMRFRFCEKLIGLGLLPVLAVLAACGGEGAPPSPPPPEVDVMTIRAASVSYTIELPARVQAMRTAEVRARVDGIVERRLYVEGSDIKAGTPMFIIDPREMRAAYNAAQAALARAESVLANARQDVERRSEEQTSELP